MEAQPRMIGGIKVADPNSEEMNFDISSIKFDDIDETTGFSSEEEENVGLTFDEVYPELVRKVTEIEHKSVVDNPGQAPVVPPATAPVQRVVNPRSGARVFPLQTMRTYEYKNNGWNNPWLSQGLNEVDADKKWPYGTVTCVVKRANDTDGSVYLLTAGHIFYDDDPNKNRSPDQDRAAGMLPNRLSYSYGEKNKAHVNASGPFADAFGSYLRMGDKLGSTCDCGLAKIRNGVEWTNGYMWKKPRVEIKGEQDALEDKQEKELVALHKARVESMKTTGTDVVTAPPGPVKEQETPPLDAGFLLPLVALDTQWPPLGWDFRCRGQKISKFDMIFEDMFYGMWDDWQGKHESNVRRAILIKDVGRNTSKQSKTGLNPGASGSALVWYDRSKEGGVVIGLLVGFSKARKAGQNAELDTPYIVFQHISVAQDMLSLSTELPRPM